MIKNLGTGSTALKIKFHSKCDFQLAENVGSCRSAVAGRLKTCVAHTETCIEICLLSCRRLPKRKNFCKMKVRFPKDKF